jgi:hypothetical protein
MAVKSQDSIHEGINGRLNSGILATFHFRVFCPSASSLKLQRLTYIQSYVLYGCETWFLTLRGAHRLRVFENRALREIFGHKREGVAGGWRRLHNEELR